MLNLYGKLFNRRKVPKVSCGSAILNRIGESRFAKEGNNFFGMRTWDLKSPRSQNQTPTPSSDLSYILIYVLPLKTI